MARFAAGFIRRNTTFDDSKLFDEFEPYNGWDNRETWALQLVLSNDEGLYNMTRERVAEVLADIDPDEHGDADQLATYRTNKAGQAVRDLWEDDLMDPDIWGHKAVLALVDEVGSYWRVDWYAIGEAWLEDAGDQPAPGGDDDDGPDDPYTPEELAGLEGTGQLVEELANGGRLTVHRAGVLWEVDVWAPDWTDDGDPVHHAKYGDAASALEDASRWRANAAAGDDEDQGDELPEVDDPETPAELVPDEDQGAAMLDRIRKAADELEHEADDEAGK